MPVYSTSCTDGRLEEGRAPATPFATARTVSPLSALERIRDRDGAVCALRPTGASSRIAREFTTATLRSWGLAELADDAVIIVSELVTNAVRHGVPAFAATPEERPVKLSLVRNGRFVVCIVTDPSEQDPTMRAPDDTCENGRGLCVIEALSRMWGWTPLAGRGKAVWAALDVP
jgi:anti-sigma regulatory factor (Ser/Thr protein kinase)